MDVLEDDEGITLLADLPGVPKDQLELRVDGDALVVEGVMGRFTPETLEPVYAEVRLPRYRRSFALSRELDASRIEANLKDGVLTLRAFRSKRTRSRAASQFRWGDDGWAAVRLQSRCC